MGEMRIARSFEILSAVGTRGTRQQRLLAAVLTGPWGKYSPVVQIEIVLPPARAPWDEL